MHKNDWKNDIYTNLLFIQKYEKYLKEGCTKKTSEKLAQLDLQIEDLKDLNKYEEDLKNIEKKNRGLNKWTTRKNK